jgi:hypothetical protein
MRENRRDNQDNTEKQERKPKGQLRQHRETGEKTEGAIKTTQRKLKGNQE